MCFLGFLFCSEWMVRWSRSYAASVAVLTLCCLFLHEICFHLIVKEISKRTFEKSQTKMQLSILIWEWKNNCKCSFCVCIASSSSSSLSRIGSSVCKLKFRYVTIHKSVTTFFRNWGSHVHPAFSCALLENVQTIQGIVKMALTSTQALILYQTQ